MRPATLMLMFALLVLSTSDRVEGKQARPDGRLNIVLLVSDDTRIT